MTSFYPRPYNQMKADITCFNQNIALISLHTARIWIESMIESMLHMYILTLEICPTHINVVVRHEEVFCIELTIVLTNGKDNKINHSARFD